MTQRVFGAVAMSLCIAANALAAPMGTGFTYQGQLKQNGTPFTGSVNLQFELWDAATNGAQIGLTQSVANAVVNGGLFTVQLNTNAEFGTNALNGDARWLQVSVDGVTLARQPLTPTPAALFSAAPWVSSSGDIFYATGNVGIGTDQPATRLHVTPAGYGAGAGAGVFVGGNPYFGGNTGLAIDLSSEFGGYATLQAIASSGVNYGPIVLNPIVGNVGIGTEVPQARLEINDTTDPTLIINSSSGNGTWLQLNSTSSGARKWSVVSSGSASAAGPGKLLFVDQSGGGGTRMVIDGAGHVGINKNAPTARLEVDDNSGTAIRGTGIIGVAGDAASGPAHYGIYGTGFGPGQKAGFFDGNVQVNGALCTTAGVGTCSDARFKEHIETLTGALAIVQKLRAVHFDWKHDQFPERRFSEQRQVGLIAQEVQRVAPDVVQKESDGYLSVDYARLTPLLIEAMQEQQKLIESRNAQLATQQKRIDDLQARLERLESLLD